MFTGVQGSPWLSTMHFAGETQTAADDAVTAVGDFWTAVQARMAQEVDWTTEPDVSQLGDTGILQTVWSTTPRSGSGTLASDILPYVSQGLIRWRTGGIVSGRELRGRTFVPGLTEVGAIDGFLSQTDRDALDNAAAALVADIASDLVIWSKAHSTTLSVITASVWSQYAVQRSRRD